MLYNISLTTSIVWNHVFSQILFDFVGYDKAGVVMLQLEMKNPPAFLSWLYCLLFLAQFFPTIFGQPQKKGSLKGQRQE